MLYSSIRGSCRDTDTDTHTAARSHLSVTLSLRYSMCSLTQTDLGEVELERIVGGQRHHESSGQILRQGVAVVAQEQAVVAQRRHGDANLSQVIKVLQDRGLTENRPPRDLSAHISPGGNRASFVFTFLRRRPWEMFSDNMKPDTRW